jgi:hypothetical protein
MVWGLNLGTYNITAAYLMAKSILSKHYSDHVCVTTYPFLFRGL